MIRLLEAASSLSSGSNRFLMAKARPLLGMMLLNAMACEFVCHLFLIRLHGLWTALKTLIKPDDTPEQLVEVFVAIHVLDEHIMPMTWACADDHLSHERLDFPTALLLSGSSASSLRR